MEVKATAKFVRGSNFKYRRYIDLIRDKDAQKALDILDHLPSPRAKVLFKILKSAIANADHNHSVPIESLIVKKAWADQGPIMKRWIPRARGRATPIQKKMSHVTIVVGTKGDID
ncbi:MAG TPA: 50S ribosomal protein L22 [bacterium]|jgi:large subunit ribosomal protein L22